MTRNVTQKTKVVNRKMSIILPIENHNLIILCASQTNMFVYNNNIIKTMIFIIKADNIYGIIT